jgi:hypothetical protein
MLAALFCCKFFAVINFDKDRKPRGNTMLDYLSGKNPLG